MTQNESKKYFGRVRVIRTFQELGMFTVSGFLSKGLK